MTSELTSFQGGRYQVLRKLGEGGKGIVFLCQDTVLGRRVAIKLIREEVLDAEGLLRFQREVQAMASLVHPNVVTVFDIGQDPSTGSGQVVGAGFKPAFTTRPYLVLELMEGGDVDHLIASAPNKRLDAATTVRIGKEVARGLEHAHRHDILHRDVKPGNIWLTREGQAKLGDFGLAYLGGGPRLTRAGMMVGSVAYMAPEVALGRQADGRSDLYMLGASLYEMVTGRVPFPGDDPVRVLFSHINDLPLSPRRFAPDIPDGLEALILRLLIKDPEQRPASATDVLRALEEVEIPPTPIYQRGARGDSVGAPLAAPRPPTPEPRFAQPLVGREREVAFLRQRVDAALRGTGGLVFLTGEVGIGKTRLAWEVRPYARGRGFLWLEGQYSREGSIPSQPWVEAIRAFLRTAPPSLLMKVLLPYGAELARLVPEVAERLGHVPSPPSIGPEEERTRLFEAIAGFFTGIAREQPLALFLDDLHWAPSIGTLHHLARSLATERLLVVGAYRDGELKEKAALARTLLAMNREQLFHSLPLRRLAEGEVAGMVAQSLGEEASARLAGMLYQKTEGNPFFVHEVLRYLTESGAITLGDQGWEVRDTTLLQMPDSVKAVVGERLERLGEKSRSILAWASVAGREFTLSLLQEVTGLAEDQLLDVVDQAVEVRVLTPRPSLGQEIYAFVDNQTRDVLYEGIGPARRRRYHLRVGQAIERVHTRHLEEHYDALARHFLEGNDLEKAAEYAVKAGDRATSVYSWDRAIGHYRNALELLEELEAAPREQAEVLEKLAEVTGLGKGKGALGYLEKALAFYDTLRDGKKAAEVHLRLAYQYGWYEVGGMNWEMAYSHCLKAVSLLELGDENSLLAQAYARSGYCAAQSGQGPVSAAIDLMEKGLALAERLDDALGVTETARFLGTICASVGEVKRGLELLHQSLEEARKSGDLVALSEGASNLFYRYASLRDAESALRPAEQAGEASSQSGAFRNEIRSALDFAWASILRGDAPRALSSLERAEQVARKGSVEVSQWSTVSIVAPGLVHFFVGDWDKVEMELLQCLETVKRSRQVSIILRVASVLGEFYLELGDFANAEAYLRETVTSSQTQGFKTFELVPRALFAEVASKGGELEDAAAHLRRAQEILSNGEDWRGLAAEVHLAEGVLATAEKRWPDAEVAFQKAVDINRQYHLPYYEARSLLEWGEMYLARGGQGASVGAGLALPSGGISSSQGAASSAPTGGIPIGEDRERGMELLAQALAIFQRIQAKKMVEKVLARKELLRA